MYHNFIDQYSGLHSAIHLLDARAKLLAAFAAILIVVTESNDHFYHFFFYLAVLAIVLVISKIPASFYFVRIFSISPVLLLAAAFLPLSHYLVTAETPDKIMYLTATIIFLKAFTSLSLLMLLVSSTGFNSLLQGMQRLGLPSSSGMLATLMYRYFFLIHDELLRTNMARNSRSAGKLRLNPVKVYSNQMAMIFLRSYDRSQRLYQAMASRGYTGKTINSHESSKGYSSWLMCVLFVMLFLFIRMFGNYLTPNF